MTPVSPRSRGGRQFAAVALVAISTICVHPVVADAQQGGEGFERWATAHAVPIQSVEPGNGAADLRRLKPIIGAARVVSLGEPAHGVHESLALRNRLFRYLVEELGFTAIAIESGFPESRRIFDFVAGGPGAAGQVVRENLTWGFGAFQENEELVRWIREYNADATHRRKVRFYGIDLSLGGPGGSTPKPAALDAALSYLARVDSTSAQRMRATFRRYLGSLSGGAASLARVEHDGASAAIDDLIALLERERPAFIAASSEADYEWAYRNAIVARQADRVFRVNPPEAPGGGIPPAAWQAVTARDAAMAENVRWVLAQEGPEGRVLVFAHNMHVKNARTEGGIWSVFERPPNAMGQYLRSALGDDLLIIGMSSAQKAARLPATPAESGSVDATLARVGPPRFLLDLRASRDDRAASAWFAERRELRANSTTCVTLSPGAAFDAIVYVDSLSSARTAPPAR